MSSVMLVNSDAGRVPLADGSVSMVCTSPPYWGLRSYLGDQGRDWPDGWHGCLGLEPDIDSYVRHLVTVFQEVRRVLHKSGTVWLNVGDSYASRPQRDNYADPKAPRRTPENRCRTPGLAPKQLCMIPARVALALQADGWWVRSEITWCKAAPMPGGMRDRPTSATEKIYLLSKSARYFYDQEAERVRLVKSAAGSTFTQGKTGENGAGRVSQQEREDNPAGRNLWDYWLIGPEPYPDAHYATFPTEIPRRCISLGSSARGVCQQCGAPWVRVIEKTTRTIPVEERNGRQGHNGQPPQQSGWYWKPPGIQETGWRPTCRHEHEPIPALVLDPFAGSGTTVMVARALGRRGVGCDLSYAYLHAQARARLELDALDAWCNPEGSKGGNGDGMQAAEAADLGPLFGVRQ